jgi:hypothetical protein
MTRRSGADRYFRWCRTVVPGPFARLGRMRVRRFELRLVGGALVVGWTISAILVLVGYRPGGPLDLLVGLTMLLPVAIAVAGLIWPPVARGSGAFPIMVWLGIVALLCLVPSIIGIVELLQTSASSALVPSPEAAYPWLIALAATSLFSGLGIARHLRGAGAIRRRRFVDGALIGTALTILAASVFAGATLANAAGIRETVPTSSRFGPTDPTGQPPLCDGPLAAGPTATLSESLDGVVDLRTIGSIELGGVRDDTDFRWGAYVATDRHLGSAGAIRIAPEAWVQSPGQPWATAAPEAVDPLSLDLQVLSTALAAVNRTTAEDRGVDVIEGARARHCVVAVDGTTFRDAFPQIQWLVGDADIHRWRGELDYWVFMDGQLGQVVGDASGDAIEIVDGAILATVNVKLTATRRGDTVVIYPP